MNAQDWDFFIIELIKLLPRFVIIGAIIGIAIYFYRKQKNYERNNDKVTKELEQEQLERNARFISARTSNKD